MPHIEIHFTGISNEIAEILIALLAEMQYEGFEESDDGLKAYISKPLFDEWPLTQLADQFQLQYSKKELPEINWNKEWESNFKPVVVDNFCAIRATFHKPVKNVQHEIIITPKMSFGTGHHATTFMMLQQMRDLDFTQKRVMDFGTGTGILAILAIKLGAAFVTAIDNDEWSINNARENLEKNNAISVDLKLAGKPVAENACDIILANIIRHVIEKNFYLMDKFLNNNGILVLSGLLESDKDSILKIAHSFHYTLAGFLQTDKWICLKFLKQY